MTHIIQMADQFGPFLADGLRANQFRLPPAVLEGETDGRIALEMLGLL